MVTPFRRRLMVLALFLLVPALHAQSEPGDGAVREAAVLTGNPTTDVLYMASAAVPAQDLLSIVARPRSVPLAAALSAALPGAGQAYNRAWVRAGIAFGIEAALIAGYVVWKGRGEDGERDFEAYAHQYWSPIRYAEWLSSFTGYGGTAIALPSLTEEQFRTPDAWTDAQQAEVRSFFLRIRAAEERSFHLDTRAAFSHVLPFFGEQQYYELIGKYFQYAPGWDDYNGANNPEEKGPDGSRVNVPPDSRFFEYARTHADANDLLRKASRVSGLLILNHFLAAVDAAVTAKLHNDRIASRMAWHSDPSGRQVPVAVVTVTF